MNISGLGGHITFPVVYKCRIYSEETSCLWSKTWL